MKLRPKVVRNPSCGSLITKWNGINTNRRAESKYSYTDARRSLQNSIRHLPELIRKFVFLLHHFLYLIYKDDEILNSVNLPRHQVNLALFLQFLFVGVLKGHCEVDSRWYEKNGFKQCFARSFLCRFFILFDPYGVSHNSRKKKEGGCGESSQFMP